MLTTRLPGLVRRLRQFAQYSGLAGADVRYVVRERELLPVGAGLQLRDLASGRDLSTVDLPFAARRIWLKNNVRIEGIERLPGATAKLQIQTLGSRPSVLRDVRARTVAGRLIADPMIGIPKIRAYDRRTAGWYIEDIVDGRVSGRADLADFVSNHGASLWLPTARLRRIKRPFQRGLIEALERSLGSIFPAMSEDALWPVSFSHNDLKLDNLLRDPGGKFWLLDWERGGVVPIVSDLGSAYLDAPELADTMVAILAAADPSGQALSPRHQLALGATLALQRRANDAGYEAMRKGFSEREAIRRRDDALNAYRRAIVALAG